jgi:thioredoxin reductase
VRYTIFVRDVVIIGGGPAGLAAALVFGRSRRRTTMFDAGEPRNATASHIHGFLTRDGTPPAEFRAIAHHELSRYASVERASARVTSIEKLASGFLVHHELGRCEARVVMLCTGLVDQLPDVPGFRALWGRSVVQCPYCHAYENAGKRFAYWPRAESDCDHALLLRNWSDDVIVFANGQPIRDELRTMLAEARIPLVDPPIVGLRAQGERLLAIEVEGAAVERDVLFASPFNCPPPLVAALRLRMFDENSVWVDDRGETSVPGIYAAGDLVLPTHGAMMAAANAEVTAYKINTMLSKADVRLQ